MNFKLISILVVLGLSIFLYKLINDKDPLIKICEKHKCPFCFGIDLCEEFEQNKFKLRMTSISDLFANYLSVKNVFYARYENNNVILKKLGHNYELNQLDELLCINNNLSSNCDLVEVINKESKEEMSGYKYLRALATRKTNNHRICALSTLDEFIRLAIYENYRNKKYKGKITLETHIKHAWTITHLNVEPKLIQILRSEDGWPVPQYLGACGRVIVENDCGSNLNDFADADWNIRASLTMQLLQAAKNFTEKHNTLRFYLTDISPDNIAVNSELKVTFVDLENVLITSRASSGIIHYSTDIDDGDDFAFSEDEICASYLSDHNYYAVCKLLLSKRAPWPMMEGGLLHSPPKSILESFPDLFELIEVCAFPVEEMNRFEAVEKILEILRMVMSKCFDYE